MANLNSTTTAGSITSSATFIPLTSLSNIARGDVILVDKEAMVVRSLSSTTTPLGVNVVRTGRAASHAPGAVVYTGAPAVFNSNDPVGVPAAGQQPYWINTTTGAVWVAQGDEAGQGALTRFWQLQTSTPGRGSLGVRTVTVAPTQAVQ